MRIAVMFQVEAPGVSLRLWVAELAPATPVVVCRFEFLRRWEQPGDEVGTRSNTIKLRSRNARTKLIGPTGSRAC